jgi:hypothetical protein
MASTFMIIRKSFFNSFLPAIIWWLIVLGIMCTPGKDFPSLGSWTELISLDKLIHIAFFGLMAYLFMRPVAVRNIPTHRKKKIFIGIAIGCSVWGLLIEFIQHFWIPGRSMDMYDFLADSVGCCVAYLYSNRYLLR